MTEDRITRRFELVTREANDFPQAAILIYEGDDVWFQDNGKAGLVHFRVCEIHATFEDGTPLYSTFGVDADGTDIEEAVDFIAGTVKWDGDLRWSAEGEFRPDDEEQLSHFLKAIERAYEIACEMVGVEENFS